MILQAKTLKGKNILRRDGDQWIVVRSSASLQCFNGDSGFLIESIKNQNSRWIREKNDADFNF